MRDERLEVSVTFDERHGYVASAPELRHPIVALSLASLRKRIEIALLPDDVRVVLQLTVSPSASATAAGRRRAGCKNWYPTFRTVSDAAGRLVHDFDRVPPDDLLSLVALRREVIIGRRFVKCLRLLQAVPLDDAHTLGEAPVPLAERPFHQQCGASDHRPRLAQPGQAECRQLGRPHRWLRSH